MSDRSEVGQRMQGRNRLEPGRLGRAAKAGMSLFAALAMAAGMAVSGYGAESSVIESLSVTFKTTYGEPEEIPDPRSEEHTSELQSQR